MDLWLEGAEFICPIKKKLVWPTELPSNLHCRILFKMQNSVSLGRNYLGKIEFILNSVCPMSFHILVISL